MRYESMGKNIGTESQSEVIKRLIDVFGLSGEPRSFEPFGNGHINGTYLLVTEAEGHCRTYVAQRINTHVFQRPDEVMENIGLVMEHLERKGIRSLRFYQNQADGSLIWLENEACWRVADFLPGKSYDETDDFMVLQEAGRAFGGFINALSDLDSSLLHETIPAFHDTVGRYNALANAEEADFLGRSRLAREELRLYDEQAEKACVTARALSAGEIPSRITHNDTKLNNVIIDPSSKQAVAVIDLDTVMPGTLLFDYGDAIRFLANMAEEDESDLTKVGFDIDRFRAFSEGFLGELRDTLTEAERALLASAPFSATVECGVRFLTDYLDGDRYFKIAYPEHNLVRARNQLALAMDMKKHEREMHECIGDILK